MARSYEFLSHPGVCLKKHLLEVGKLCRSKAIDLEVKNSNLLDIIEIVGKFHDFGKYSKFFQEYLSSDSKGRRELSRHSALSAIFSSWLVSKIYNEPFLTAIAFYSVYRHHGDLVDKVGEIFDYTYLDDILSNCKKQISSLTCANKEFFQEVEELLCSLNTKVVDVTINDFFKECESCLPTLKDATRKFNLRDKEKDIFKNFYTLCLIFSLLIDFDKKSAGRMRVEESVERLNHKPSDLADAYVEQLNIKHRKLTLMDELRKEVRNGVLETFQKMTPDSSLVSKKIMTITAPTGSGKTLLSLSVATRLRDLMKGAKPRIIYVLPYVNIVEQTYDVFKDVLGSEDINILLKHHHKAFGSIMKERMESLPVEEILLLVESWDSEFVVTTAVQFFETLFGFRNRMLKKFNELFKSIIILDEIQTLPIEYWRLVKEALESLVSNSSCYVIYMSATRPIIFKGQELLENHEKYFKNLKRVSFKYVIENFSIDEAIKYIFDKWDLSISLLVVLNTIKSSIEFYDKFKDVLIQKNIDFTILTGDEDQIDVSKLVISYLSTNIIPLHRFRRINKIKEFLKAGAKIVLISTQVVEAGVDLDFDMAIRDIGPFDSIVQVAGRCNRNGSKKQGDFYVLRIVDEKGELYAKRVYGKLTIQISERILTKRTEFEESDILDMISCYYKECNRVFGEESDEYRSIIGAVKDLDLGSLREFKIIKEEPKHSVFIEYNKEAIKVKNEFFDLIEKRKQVNKELIYELIAKIRAKRGELENYMVDTIADISGLPSFGLSDIFYVSLDDVSKWYDKETGFKAVEWPLFI